MSQNRLSNLFRADSSLPFSSAKHMTCSNCINMDDSTQSWHVTGSPAALLYSGQVHLNQNQKAHPAICQLPLLFAYYDGWKWSGEENAANWAQTGSVSVSACQGRWITCAGVAARGGKFDSSCITGGNTLSQRNQKPYWTRTAGSIRVFLFRFLCFVVGVKVLGWENGGVFI